MHPGATGNTLQVKLYSFSEDDIVAENRTDTYEMPHCGILSGSSLFPKVFRSHLIDKVLLSVQDGLTTTTIPKQAKKKT